MTLKDLLSQYSGQKVWHLLSQGNRGDALINQSSKYLLKKYGIQTTEVWHPDNVRGNVLFVNGAGGFCKEHHNNVARVKFYLNRFNLIYILSASFDINCQQVADFLKSLVVQERVVIFCREKYSYAQVAQIYPKDKLFLDHDFALYFDWDSIKKKGGRGRLNAFRTDAEHDKNRIIPSRNWDVSRDKYLYHNWRFFNLTKGLNYKIKSKLYFFIEKQRCYDFINDINQYDEVHTDRAHVAIASGKLGKETYVYSNNYHKVKSIYDYSLRSLKKVYYRENYSV